MSHEADLLAFVANLVPGEPLAHNARGQQRHDTARKLAPHRLTDDHEATAQLLAYSTAEAHRRGLSIGRRERAIRPTGEQLGARGGAYLMLLIAHRAQHIQDPHWETTRAEVRPIRRTLITSTSGPLVSMIESAWDGICGWTRQETHKPWNSPNSSPP